MNDNAHRDELPELSDDDIALLHSITTLASTSPDPPFKALFAAYDHVFAQEGLESEHDGVVFRLLLRVGEAAREGGGAGGRRVDLVGCLKEILAAQGITVVENEDEDESNGTREETRSVNVGNGNNGVDALGGRKMKGPPGRRVSFDDAKLDETWLSEHARGAVASPPRQLQGQRNLLAQPARRGRLPDAPPPRRARSISSQRTDAYITRHAAPKHFQQASPSTVYTSEPEDNFNPTLLFQPSQTQLEQNAAAFATTSAIRATRKYLHGWHDIAIQLYHTRRQAYAIATAHDSRTLVKQAFDQWRTTLNAQREERRDDATLARKTKYGEQVYHNKLLFRYLWKWAAETRFQHLQTQDARHHLIAFRYFRRWRALTLENAIKSRSLLTRKYLAVWRERLVRQQMKEEQAVARFEEVCQRRCYKAWFWHFCSRRVVAWRETKLKERTLAAWVNHLREQSEQDLQATEFYNITTADRTFNSLRQRLTICQQATRKAQVHHDQTLTRTCLYILATEAKLSPLGRTLTLKSQLDLQRKALHVWHRHFTLTRQAAEINRKRILQSAWTAWNDALRCRALAQRIDARVAVENLYRWVLAERLQTFRRSLDARIARQVLGAWRFRVGDMGSRLEVAEAAFAERRRRRRLAFGIHHLHLTMRIREDADRAAVEFANARILPGTLAVLAQKTRHVLDLHKWARDARFYTLCTRALTVWKERTTQHMHHRRRDAYARVRARIKIRLAGSCLARWRAKTAELTGMHQEAERRAQMRVLHIGTAAFDHWRDRTVEIRKMDAQALDLDARKLLGSALSALVLGHTHLISMDSQAVVYKQETDLALISAALKKIQWAQFTAVRRTESAEALWLRNRDQHVRHMLRHWCAQVITRRATRAAPAIETATEEVDEEPDSPSLRPASRRAGRSSIQSPPPSGLVGGTPGYMRTPSRSRRAGRFRGIPTPAPITPFQFDSAYLITTPAPLLTGGNAEDMVSGAGTGPQGLTPQVTPFARKLRAGGFGRAGGLVATPALRSSVFGARVAVVGGTAKSVRFAGPGRFGKGGS